MNVSVAPELEKVVENLVASGRYRDHDEVVAAAIRLLDEQQSKARESLLDDFLRKRLEEGEEFTPTESDWEALRQPTIQ